MRSPLWWRRNRPGDNGDAAARARAAAERREREPYKDWPEINRAATVLSNLVERGLQGRA